MSLLHRNQHLPQGQPLAIGFQNPFVHGGPTYASGRVVNDPSQSLLIGVIHHQAQIGQEIFDLSALIKTKPSNHLVRNILPAQGFLERPGLGIGSVQDGEVLVAQAELMLGRM